MQTKVLDIAKTFCYFTWVKKVWLMHATKYTILTFIIKCLLICYAQYHPAFCLGIDSPLLFSGQSMLQSGMMWISYMPVSWSMIGQLLSYQVKEAVARQLWLVWCLDLSKDRSGNAIKKSKFVLNIVLVYHIVWCLWLCLFYKCACSNLHAPAACTNNEISTT